MDLRIRRYEPGDREVVWELHNLALNIIGAHGGNGEWDADLHRIEEVYLDAGGEFLVGELDGRVVAMGALRRIGDAEAEVKRMRVDPDLQRRGYGRAILEALLARAEELGYTTLRLDTTTKQIPAQRLYESHGFEVVGTTRVAGHDVLLYERRLAQRRDRAPLGESRR